MPIPLAIFFLLSIVFTILQVRSTCAVALPAMRATLCCMSCSHQCACACTCSLLARSFPTYQGRQKGHFRARHFPGVITFPVQNGSRNAWASAAAPLSLRSLSLTLRRPVSALKPRAKGRRVRLPGGGSRVRVRFSLLLPLAGRGGTCWCAPDPACMLMCHGHVQQKPSANGLCIASHDRVLPLAHRSLRGGSSRLFLRASFCNGLWFPRTNSAAPGP